MIKILDRLTLGEGWLLRIDGDPSSGVGLDAPIGSYAQWDNGSAGKQYIKVSADANGWQEVATQNYVSSVKATIDQSIAAEVSRAQAAESSLQSAINALDSDSSAALDAEISRAQAAEASLQSAIAAEQSRAEAAEADLAADLAAEQSRAEAAEAAEQAAREAEDLLFLKLDGSRAMEDDLDMDGSKIIGVADGVDANDAVNKSQLDAEVSRLDDRIDKVISNIDPDALDSLAEVVAAFQDADGNLTGAINALSTSSSSAIAAEQSRAEAAEADLAADLAAEQSRAEAAEADLAADLAAEQSRAEAAEADLAADLAAEQSRAEAAEASLQSAIDAEAQNLLVAIQNSEESLRSVIVDETIAREAADVALQAAIDTETAARLAADSTLQSEVDAEEARALAAESAEQAAREVADAALDARLDVLEADPVTKTYVDGKVSELTSDIVDLDGYTQDIRSDLDDLDGYAQEIRSDLDQEILDRAAAEAGLQSAIDTEKGRVDAILLASEADKDSFAEIVQLINLVDTENDSAFASYVLSNNAALAQEVLDRQADDTTLQSAIDAEETAREAADAALDARLDVLETDPTTKTYVDNQISAVNSSIDDLDDYAQEIRSDLDQEILDRVAGDAALQSAIDAETAARAAQDLVLDGKIDTKFQDSKDYTDQKFQDSKDYTDQKVANLVNSAPEVLDTLKELADALGGDENFATTVANNIATVSNNLAAEVSRAQAAEITLDGRLDVLEADPVTKTYVDNQISAVNSSIDDLDGYAQDIRADLDQEIIDRATADLSFVKTDGSRSMQKLDVTGDVTVSGAGSKIKLLAGSEFYMVQASASTTDATQTSIQSVSIPLDSMVHVRTTIIARKSSGAGTGDGAVYVREARYKNIGGVVTVHTVQSTYTSEDISGLDATMGVSGSNATVLVVGASATNLDWECTTEVTILG